MQNTYINFSNLFNKYLIYFKEGAWLIFGQVLSFSASLYGVRVLTQKLGSEEYGILSLSLTFVALLSQILFAPLSAGSTRFYIVAKEKNELNNYVSALNYFLLIFSVFSFLITLIVGLFLIFTSNADLIYILVFVLFFSVIGGVNLIFTSIQMAARQRSLVAMLQGVDSWSKYLIAFFLITIFGSFTISVVTAYVFSSILFFLIQFYFLRNIISFRNYKRDRVWEQKIWKYIFPYISWGLFTWAQISSDKWVLAFFSTPKEVGLYTGLYQIGYFPISVVTGLGIQFLTPIFFQKVGDGDDSEKIIEVNSVISKITLIGLIITGVVFIVSLFFHKEIFSLFFQNTDYFDISYLFPWLILSGGIFACAQALSLDLMNKLQTSSLAKIKISTAILGISTNFMFGFFFEIKGIVFSSLIFSAIYFLWIRYKVQNHL